MVANFPNFPNVNDTYQFNNLTFVYDGSKWKVNGQLSYIQDAIQYIRSGPQVSRPTVNAPALYYNTDLQGLELYYPEIDTWEVVSSFAKQVDPTNDTGQTAYNSPGTFSWTCPANVYQVHVVAVGGGGNAYYSTYGGCGGGGGGLGWKNNIPVVPGTSYAVVVGGVGGTSYFINTSTVAGFGGANGAIYSGLGGVGGGFVPSTQGGNGGQGGSVSAYYPGGGGGAGGYSGNGGAGGGTLASGSAGAGGAAGGGGSGGYNLGTGGGGGGVGILGQGTSGNGGFYASGGYRGGGGSSGVGGGIGTSGGAYGGGGGSASQSQATATGAVRIIWGPGRSFPATNTGDL